MTHRLPGSLWVPKKFLGQNFLTDRRIQQKIVDHCDLQPEETVIEIGPGQGALTRLIAPRIKRLICVETDRDLIGPLSREFQNTNVEVVRADFLKFDLHCHSRESGNLKVIGNIPYYISTPIIEKLIESRHYISRAYLTVQLEFGRRLAAAAGGKDYGSLSCFAQYWGDVKVLFNIKNTCFKPAPKVDSCFVRLDFTQAPRYKPADEAFLFRLIRAAFSQRRKIFINAAAGVIEKERLEEILKQLGISPKIRPEDLNLQNFVDICEIRGHNTY